MGYQGYKGYKVTKVTVLVQIFKINSGFQGFRSYGGYGGLLLMIFLDIPRVTRLQRLRCFFQIFKRSNQGYKVSEVTRVTEGFCWWFSLTSPELQGYEGYGVFFFQIFNNKNVPNLPSCFTGNKVKSYNAFSIIFDQNIQGYEVTRLRRWKVSNSSI